MIAVFIIVSLISLTVYLHTDFQAWCKEIEEILE